MPAQKIKVLHIIKSLGRGGAEMLLPETLKLHDQTRFEFHYIYFLPWKHQLVSAIETAGGKVTCFSAGNNITLLLQYPKIIQYIRQHQIQLIHAHLPWAGFVSRLVHKCSGIALLYTEHNLQERYHIITRSINRWTFNAQTLAIGVSENVSDSIRKNIQPVIPVQTVLNGVATDSFKKENLDRFGIRKQYGIPEKAIVIGIVAVFRFQKRLDLWLEIMRHCIGENSNIYGLIVGGGPLEKELKDRHAELDLGSRVLFSGLQSDVKPFYETMDIFMMSSSFEGLPIALLEAMSMECAIVTTDAGGVKEVVRPEKDGLVCAVDDWNKLPSYCLELAANPERLAQFKSNARNRVAGQFSLNATVTQLEQLYLQYHS